jgi:hypothetical protein
MGLTNSHHQPLRRVKTLVALKYQKVAHKIYSEQKSMGYKGHFCCLRALDVKMRSQNEKILLFIDLYIDNLHDTRYLKHVKDVYFPHTSPAFSSHLATSCEHYYHKQFVTETIFMTDHKLLHNGTIMKVTVLDAQHFIAEP